MKKIQNSRKFRRGQGMTEYIIIVALIAIGAIGVITVFGDNIRALFGTATSALAGEDRDTKARKSTNDWEQKDIKTFGKENQSASQKGS